jgi:hypothetical protein
MSVDAIVMYSGQLDSVIATCVYAEQHRADQITLVTTIGIGLRPEAPPLAQGISQLRQRYPNITGEVEIPLWREFATFGIGTLEEWTLRLKMCSIWFGCQAAILAGAIDAARSLSAHTIVTGYRLRPDWGEHYVSVFRELAALPERFGLNHETPVLDMAERSQLLRAYEERGLTLTIPPYTCLFSGMKSSPYFNSNSPELAAFGQFLAAQVLAGRSK